MHPLHAHPRKSAHIPHTPSHPLTPPSQLKQLRQQLATTQRLLDSYGTRGTAGDLRELLPPPPPTVGAAAAVVISSRMAAAAPGPVPLRAAPVRPPRRRCLLLPGRGPVFT